MQLIQKHCDTKCRDQICDLNIFHSPMIAAHPLRFTTNLTEGKSRGGRKYSRESSLQMLSCARYCSPPKTRVNLKRITRDTTFFLGLLREKKLGSAGRAIPPQNPGNALLRQVQSESRHLSHDPLPHRTRPASSYVGKARNLDAKAEGEV